MSYYPMTATGKSVAAAADAAALRSTAGLGTISTQNANNVSITGGSLSGVDAIINDKAATYVSDTTLDGSKNVIVASSNSNTVAITLPAASGSGARYDIKRNGSNAVTVVRAGSDTIDGGAGPLSLANLESVTLVDTGNGKWTQH
jgi:hypothetical protein